MTDFRLHFGFILNVFWLHFTGIWLQKLRLDQLSIPLLVLCTCLCCCNETEICTLDLIILESTPKTETYCLVYWIKAPYKELQFIYSLKIIQSEKLKCFAQSWNFKPQTTKIVTKTFMKHEPFQAGMKSKLPERN